MIRGCRVARCAYARASSAGVRAGQAWELTAIALLVALKSSEIILLVLLFHFCSSVGALFVWSVPD
jgi:hypothetical protein